jgi:hypothetical protein
MDESLMPLKFLVTEPAAYCDAETGLCVDTSSAEADEVPPPQSETLEPLDAPRI